MIWNCMRCWYWDIVSAVASTILPVDNGRVWLGRSGCSKIVAMASSRKPSTPRSSQKRTISHIAALTSGLRQLRSGCSLRKA